MWRLRTWFSGELGNAGLTVGLDELDGLFQPEQFYDTLQRTRYEEAVWLKSL